MKKPKFPGVGAHIKVDTSTALSDKSIERLLERLQMVLTHKEFIRDILEEFFKMEEEDEDD